MLSEHQKRILESFNPWVVFFRIIYELCVTGVCISVAITYTIDVSLYQYIILYSYWNTTTTGVVFLYAALISTWRLYLYCYGRSNSKWARYFIVFDYLRDCALVVVFTQLVISSAGFWASGISPRGLEYPTLVGHSVVLGLVFLELFFTTVYFSEWAIGTSLYYALAYFFFHIWIYYYTNIWTYLQLNPDNFPKWWTRYMYIVVGQGFVLFAFAWCNHYKNIAYTYLYEWGGWHVRLVDDVMLFGTREKDQFKFEVTLLLIVPFLYSIYWCGGQTWALFNILDDFTIWFLGYVVLYFIAECVAFSYEWASISVDSIDLRTLLKDTWNLIRFSIGNLVVLGLIILVTRHTSFVWIFLSFGVYFLSALISRLILYLYLHNHHGSNKVVTGYF